MSILFPISTVNCCPSGKTASFFVIFIIMLIFFIIIFIGLIIRVGVEPGITMQCPLANALFILEVELVVRVRKRLVKVGLVIVHVRGLVVNIFILFVIMFVIETVSGGLGGAKRIVVI